jgi:hypothetical protein
MDCVGSWSGRADDSAAFKVAHEKLLNAASGDDWPALAGPTVSNITAPWISSMRTVSRNSIGFGHTALDLVASNTGPLKSMARSTWLAVAAYCMPSM